MRILFILLFTYYSMNGIIGRHVLGGEMYYECGGMGKYTVTMILYRDCVFSDSLSVFDSSPGAKYNATITVFKGTSRDPFIDSIPLGPPTVTTILHNNNIDFCTDVPKRCLEQGVYTFDIDLPPSDESYYIVYQRCCRTPDIDNIMINNGRNGMTLMTEINPLSQSTCNSGLKFKNTVPRLLCVGEPWLFDHSAIDLDSNSAGRIEYSFCSPLQGGDWSTPRGVAPNPEDPPPYNNIQFAGGRFTETSPFGSSPPMFIDKETGVITVTPQFTGRFIVGVCAKKYDENDSLLFSITRDYQFRVGDCLDKVTAGIQSDTILDGKHIIKVCGDSVLKIENLSTEEGFIKSYNWYVNVNGDQQTYFDESPYIILPEQGTYEGLLVLNEGKMCPDTAFFQIEVLGAIENDFMYEYDTCQAGPIDLDGIASTGNGAIIEHIWYLNGEDTLNTRNVQYEFREPGRKVIQYIVRDNKGCKSTTSKSISYFPIPNEILVDPVYSSNCSPASVLFNNYSYPLDSNYDIFWQFGENLTSSLISPEILFEHAGSYSVYLSIHSPIGCIYEGTLEETIEIMQSPQAGFAILPHRLNQFTKEIFITDQSQNSSEWKYVLSTGSMSNLKEPQFNISDTGSYWIDQLVIHANGCRDSIRKSFEVVLEPVFHLPNAFTPDRDGVNDVFAGKGDFSSFRNFEMSIFNRWGERIFYTTDPTVGWNGSKNNIGLTLPNAVYIVKLRYESLEGEPFSFTSFATLIR